MNRIVILGAGYAGVSATVSLAARTRRRDDVHITLVNADERFTERLRLHQTASGQQLADLRIPQLLDGTGVEFVRGWVTGVDAAARTVRVDDERVLKTTGSFSRSARSLTRRPFPVWTTTRTP